MAKNAINKILNALKYPVNLIPGIGCFLSAVCSIGASLTDTKIEEIQQLLACLDARLHGEERLTKAILNAIPVSKENYENLDLLIQAQENPDGLTELQRQKIAKISTIFDNENRIQEFQSKISGWERWKTWANDKIIEHEDALQILTNSIKPSLDPGNRNIDISKSSSIAHIAEYRVEYTDIYGRNHERIALKEFLDIDKQILLWTIEGTGGIGKSRLSLDLCNEARTQKWEAGFLSNLNGDEFNFSGWYPKKNTLIIIDYASNRNIKKLKHCILELYNKSKTYVCKIRFLLIDRTVTHQRHGNAEYSTFDQSTSDSIDLDCCAKWFKELTADINIEKLLYIHSTYGESLSLTALQKYDIIAIFSQIAEKSGQNISSYFDNMVQHFCDVIDPLKRPLFAIFYAKLVCHNIEEIYTTKEKILKSILDHEERIWGDKEDSLKTKNLLCLTTIIGLLSVLNEKQNQESNLIHSLLHSPISDYLPEQIICMDEKQRNIFRRPDNNSPLLGLEPDILGEYFVYHHLKENRILTSKFKTWLLMYCPIQLSNFLSRIIVDFQEYWNSGDCFLSEFLNYSLQTEEHLRAYHVFLAKCWDTNLDLTESLKLVLIRNLDASAFKDSLMLYERAMCYKYLNTDKQMIADSTAVILNSEVTNFLKAGMLFERGLIYFKNNQFDKAILDFSQIIELSNIPATLVSEAYLFRAMSYCQNHTNDFILSLLLSESDYSKAIEMPAAFLHYKAKALINRGDIFTRFNKLDKALKDFTAAIDLKDISQEQKTIALVNRGILYEKKNLITLAMEDYTVAIAIGNQIPEQQCKAYHNRASIFVNNNIDKAMDDYSTVINMDNIPLSEKAKSLINRGILYMNTQALDKAITDFNAVYKMNGIPPELTGKALLNRGATYFRKLGEQYQNYAFRDYYTVISDSSYSKKLRTQAYFNRGDSFRTRGEFDNAITDFTESIKIAEDMDIKIYSYLQRVLCYIAIGNSKLAQQDIHSVLVTNNVLLNIFLIDDTEFEYPSREIITYD